ncbi:hypothetical protein AVEN_50044-1 [Araneus ventricosus]|uniref:Uncharacterized protein n=1 Tax=Araneus ventricosus TaxID=182803 RepID=A0A4Y2PSN8_ARAVE|nr:hypothetical protein AVEN_50044-1 [Araneus ventricosus]
MEHPYVLPLTHTGCKVISWLVTPVRSCPSRNGSIVLPAAHNANSVRKRNGTFTNLLAEVETDEDPDMTMKTMDLRMSFPNRNADFGNEDNGPEDVLEEISSDHESFYEHDTESEEGGDSGNEDVNNLELFS